MDLKVNWNNYEFKIQADEFEDDVINIRVIDSSMNHAFPVFHLELKGLWNRNGEGFNSGDYYQRTMNKESFDFWNSWQNEIINGQNPIFPSNTSLKTNIKGGLGIWAGYGSDVVIVNTNISP